MAGKFVCFWSRSWPNFRRLLHKRMIFSLPMSWEAYHGHSNQTQRKRSIPARKLAILRYLLSLPLCRRRRRTCDFWWVNTYSQKSFCMADPLHPLHTRQPSPRVYWQLCCFSWVSSTRRPYDLDNGRQSETMPAPLVTCTCWSNGIIRAYLQPIPNFRRQASNFGGPELEYCGCVTK